MDKRSVINRRDMSKVAVPELQQKVAAALMHLGRHRDAREILIREPKVLPDGRIKPNLTPDDIPADFTGMPQLLGYADGANAFYEHADFDIVDDHVGVLVAYSTPSYHRLTEHLGDYDDDPEAHDAIYDDLGRVYREGIVWVSRELLREHPWYDIKLPSRGARKRLQLRNDLVELIDTIVNDKPSVWDIADVINENTAFYASYPGDVCLNAVVIDDRVFRTWANRVLAT